MRGDYYNTDAEKADHAQETYDETCAKCIYHENGHCENGREDICTLEYICRDCECADDCDGIMYMSKDQCEKKRGMQ